MRKTIDSFRSSVLALLLAFVTGLACIAATASPSPADPPPATQPAPGSNVKLQLPLDPTRITIKQRQSKSIPGSQDQLHLQIDDITGGQVLVEIRTSEDERVLDTVSMRAGHAQAFTVGREEFFLVLVRLKNFAIGEDFAVFEITRTKPAGADPAEPPREADPLPEPV